MRRDVWASWLLERRSGGDPDAGQRVREELRPLVESGTGTVRRATAYVSAVKGT